MIPHTLRQWVQYAAEVQHPKTHCGIYPFLRDWPQFKPLCQALTEAAQAGESTAIQWEIADEIDRLLVAIRARREDRPADKPTVGKASDVLTKPQEIRDHEAELRALKAKVKKAQPMPALFDPPKKPTPQVRNTDRAFFEPTRSA